jgi:hypothetical protein
MDMEVRREYPLVDDILAPHLGALGGEAGAYRNHVYRVLNYYAALAAADPPDAVLIAAAFHDLGIWTDGTFDYLPPSVRLARAYLGARGLAELEGEVVLLIEQHHKLRGYRGPFAPTVELFRRADLIDLSLGAVRFDVPPKVVQAIKAAFPDEGFHARLVSLAARHLVKSPLRPLPMVRW